MGVIAKVLWCISIGLSVSVLAESLSIDSQEIMNSYKAINALFAQIHMVVINKEKMSDVEWIEYLKADDSFNNLSDARIYSFDENILTEVSKKIDEYLQKKMRDEMRHVIDHGVDYKGVKKFLAMSKLLCEFGVYEVNCEQLIDSIENENREIIARLKQQKEGQQKEVLFARENMLSQCNK